MKKMMYLTIVILIAAAILSACTAPAAPVEPLVTPPVETAAPTDLPTVVVTAEPTEMPSIDPTDATGCTEPVTLTPDGDNRITYKNISFVLDPALASSVTVKECPVVEYADGQAPGEAHPAYVSFAFPTSRVRIYFQPELRVYQIEGDMGQYLYPMNSLPELRDVLNQQTLPINWWNGAHLATNRGYLNFASGEGVRGLVEFSQDYFFYNNNDLVYQYDGLSSNDRYYVNLTYPIAAPFLMDMYGSDPTTNLNRDAIAVPEWPEDYEAQTEIIRAYNEEAMKRFEQLPDEGFDPSLKLLDEMMQSVVVQ